MIHIIDLNDKKVQIMLVKQYMKENGFGSKLKCKVEPIGIVQKNGQWYLKELKIKTGDDMKNE